MTERECNAAACGWRGAATDCVTPKHVPEMLLCPECHETTEAVTPADAPGPRPCGLAPLVSWATLGWRWFGLAPWWCVGGVVVSVFLFAFGDRYNELTSSRDFSRGIPKTGPSRPTGSEWRGRGYDRLAVR